MPVLLSILLFSLTTILPFLFSLSNSTQLTPQIIAAIALPSLYFLKKDRLSFLFLISTIVNLAVYTSGGLSSPLFFLHYFFLFVLAFKKDPLSTLGYSLVLIILLSQSLNGTSSLLSLISLALISPLAWTISQNQTKTSTLETDFLYWHQLKFKTGITTIIDAADQLISKSTPPPKSTAQLIKKSATSLLHSSQQLTKEIDD